MNKTFLTSLLSVLLLAVVSCIRIALPSDDDGKLEPAVDIKLTRSQAEMAADVNAFGFNLFMKAYRAEEGKDVLISPLSVSQALSMTATGAAGETAEAMTRTLGFEGRSVQEMDEFYFTMLEGLKKADKSITFEIANSIWTARGLKVLESFIGDCSKWFNSEVYPDIDFASQNSVSKINGWCSEKTHGKIDSILKQPDPEIRMLLANALYFKAKWGYEFGNTEKGAFHAAGGDIQVDYMPLDHKMAYVSDGSVYEAVSLPYGNGAFNMAVIKPIGKHGVDEAAAAMGKNWSNSIIGLSSAETSVDFKMPEFRLEYTRDIAGILSDMGMAVAFGGGADFSGMTGPGERLRIDFVKHKTYIDVNREGSEAAAVTVVGVKRTSVDIPGKPVVFHADGPFAYVIYERSTGTVLFIGTKNR